MWTIFDKFTWLLDVDNVLLNIFLLILGWTFNILSLIMIHSKQRSHDKLRIKIPITECKFSYHAHTYNIFQATHWVKIVFSSSSHFKATLFLSTCISNSSLQLISLLSGSNLTVQFENALYWNLKWFIFVFYPFRTILCGPNHLFSSFMTATLSLRLSIFSSKIINYFSGGQPKVEFFSCMGYSA